ncbi:MAG: hypothetical protein M1508_07880 [Nitrospirae bacterium]|nr:hypothetical protein [Nitrospirota bacterium]
MKRAMTVVVMVAIALFASTAVYAWWGGYGMGYGTGANVETMKKFQKETLILRDELMTRNIELQNEYSKSVPDTDRIVTLKKEIIDLEAKIQGIADKYNMPSGGHMGGMMMGRGMMGGSGMGHGYGMMGSGCGCGYCGW